MNMSPLAPASLPATLSVANVADPAGSLVFFPDFGGNTLYARNLIRPLARDVTSYCLRFAPDMTARLDQLSVEDIARRFADDIRAAGLSGPIHLIGYSFAGYLAYETARQLALDGAPAESLWIIDLQRRRRPGLRQVLRHPVYHFIRVRRHIKANWRSLLLGRSDPDILAAYGAWRIDMKLHPESYRYILRCMYAAMLAYIPKPSPTPTVILCAERNKSRMVYGDDLGWRSVASGPLRTVLMPGDHLTMVNDAGHAAVIADCIRAALRGPAKNGPKT